MASRVRASRECQYTCFVHTFHNDIAVMIWTLSIKWVATICDRILENSSKSHIKSSVFLHVFNDISTYVYVFMEYFIHSFSNLSIKFLVVL